MAQSWLILDLTKSSFFLGLDDFLGQLPILLFTVLGGVIADRYDRRQHWPFEKAHLFAQTCARCCRSITGSGLAVLESCSCRSKNP